VVVDGSNLATEGRTSPSLAQLDEAVRSYAAEDPGSSIIVVVDATFEHRVSESERDRVREAMLDGEMVSPPAGAIGRGDAFVLRIAERTNAVVLSNDSFQEFHGEHPWLFDEGRLMGGKPVPGVGWIFTPRLPIRGPKSRAATAEAKSKKDHDSAPEKAAELARAAKKAAKRGKSAKKAPKASVPLATSWPLVPTTPPPVQAKVDPVFVEAIDEAVEEALHPPGPKAARHADSKTATTKGGKAKKDEGGRSSAGTAPANRGGSKKKRRVTSPPPAVNEPLAFINFVAAFAVGGTVEGEVVSFTSHGAMVDVGLPVGGVLHCYIPLTAMGTPPPTKARQVLKKGEVRPFLLAGLDPPRRVAELALPAADARSLHAAVTTATAVAPAGDGRRAPAKASARKGRAGQRTAEGGLREGGQRGAEERTAGKSSGRKAASRPKKGRADSRPKKKLLAAAKRAPAKATPATPPAAPVEKTPARRAPASAEKTAPAKVAAARTRKASPPRAKAATSKKAASMKTTPSKKALPDAPATRKAGSSTKKAGSPTKKKTIKGTRDTALAKRRVEKSSSKKAAGRTQSTEKSQPAKTSSPARRPAKKIAAKKAAERPVPAKKPAKTSKKKAAAAENPPSAVLHS
jgi:hypothetical protein